MKTNSIEQVVPVVLAALALSLSLAFALIYFLNNSSAAAGLRTSSSIAFNEIADTPTITPIVNILEQTLGIPSSQFESPVVTKYSPGACFKPHHDASMSRGNEWSELGGQRIATAILYLRDLDSGSTKFSKLNISVPCESGKLLVFFPSDENKQCDERLLHEGTMVENDEEKWIMQIFVREKEVPHPLGLPDYLSL